MTEVLYMDSINSCYDKEFEAKVLEVDTDERSIILDRTGFYPLGGGQPNDTGHIEWAGKSSEITDVRKKRNIEHFIKGDLPQPGDKVRCHIDWDRRYAHMKMHTAQHLLSAVIWERFKAATVGNQIHETHSHIDFHPASFTMDELKEVEEKVNSLIIDNIEVTATLLDRKVIEEKIENERVDLSRLPISVKVLRTIMIGTEGNIDMCPCAGTHIRSLSEMGRMKIVKRKSKGLGKVRVQYILEDA